MTVKITIDKEPIPVPKPNKNKWRNELKKLEPGQSMLIHCTGEQKRKVANSISSSVNGIKTMKFQVSAKKFNDEDPDGVRVWRVE